MDGILSLHLKFNSLLNDVAAHFSFNRMYLDKCASEYQFNRMGYLSNDGMADFWREVDDLVEQFNCDKVKLLPRVNECEKFDYLSRKSQR